jgi:hypothetical protein
MRQGNKRVLKWDSRCSCFVTLRVNPAPVLCRDPNKQEIRQYQAGRNALYQRAANIIGSNVMPDE